MATLSNTLLDAIKSTLQANLPALLTAEGEATPITGYLLGDPGKVWKTFAPRIWIDLYGDEPEKTGADTGSNKGGEQEITFEGRIGVIVSGSTLEGTSRSLRTHTDAVRVALQANALLGGALREGVDSLELGRAGYGENEGAHDGGRVQESVRPFTIVYSNKRGES